MKARLSSFVSAALLVGSMCLVACANGEPVAGDDLAWEGREDAGARGGSGGDSGGGSGGGGSSSADAGPAPSADSGTGGVDAGTPTFDAGTGGGGGEGGGTCSPQYATQNQACSDCSRSQCCSSMNAFFGDASYRNFATCLTGCGGGTSCVQSCRTQYPGIGAKFDAYYGCTQLSCSSACGSGGGGSCTPTQNLPSTFPAACNACARSSCCASMNTFYTSTQVAAYLNCLDMLGCDGTDPSCDLICMRAYPTGAAQADAFVSCLQSSCAVQCP